MSGPAPALQRTAWRGLFVLVLLLILWLALRPVEGHGDWFPQADKLRHAAAFAVLWLLACRAGLGQPRALAWGLFALGVGIEFAQAFTPDRDPSALDVLADVAGMLLGHVLTRRRPFSLPAT